MSVDAFPSEPLFSLCDSRNIAVSENNVIFRCPYSKVFMPAKRTAITIGQNEDKICLDPKYIEKFCEEISELDKTQTPPSKYMRFPESSVKCIGCQSETTEGLSIDMSYYITGELESRTLEKEENISLTMLYSQEQVKCLSVCMDCLNALRQSVPNPKMYSIIASRSL